MRPFFLLLISLFLCSTLVGQQRIEKLHEGINTPEFDEISPIVSHNRKVLYFTRIGTPDFEQSINEKEDKGDLKKFLSKVFSQISGKEIVDPVNSEYNQDIWVANGKMGVFENVKNPGSPINNAYPNSICSIFSKERALIVLNQFPTDGGIREGFSKVHLLSNGGYSVPKDLNIFEYYDLGEDVHLSMSKDGEHLFISLQKEDSSGDNDIYLSLRVGDNLWSHPIKIPGNVNSTYRETSPFISFNKKQLFFSSNRPGGYGGQDIYVCERLDYSYENWSEPVLLPKPINSEYNDVYPCLDKVQDYLYFSSDRDGSNDIFKAKMKIPKALKEPLTIKMKIIDGVTLETTRGEILWGKDQSTKYTDFFRAYNGEHKIVIKENERYKFKVEKRGYVSEEILLDPFDLVQDGITVHELEIYVFPNDKFVEKKDLPAPFMNKRKVILRNIYFEKAQDVVLPKSFPELKKLAKVLKENPSLYIRIEGHTDNVGEKQALVDLSLKRANSIKKYLVEAGINPVKVETIGFGSANPLNHNQTETDKERNRRVEIRILKE